MIDLWSLNLIKVYAILRKDFTNDRFVLTHHLIRISVHNSVPRVVQIVRYRRSVVGIKTGRVGVRVSVWLDSTDEIKTLTDVWLIG